MQIITVQTITSKPATKSIGWLIFVLSLAILSSGAVITQAATKVKSHSTELSINPLRALGGTAPNSDTKSVRISLDVAELDKLVEINAQSKSQTLQIPFPIKTGEALQLNMKSFSVTTSKTRFIIADASGEREIPAPQVTLLRGSVEGDLGSHAFLALSAGSSSGVVTLSNGAQYFLTSQQTANNLGASEALITSANNIPQGDLPEGVEFCGLNEPATFSLPSTAAATNLTNRGVKTAYIAIDADSLFVDIFAGDETATAAYIVQLFGAVSAIYERDVDMRVKIDRVRLWSSGGEPYQSDDVGSLSNWWNANEDLTGLNFVHLLSGRRDLPFGGIAFFSTACSASSYAISGYLNGAFATPLENRSLNNWDITVVSHEMGHNSGSGHTHDSYTPTIDDCGNGVPSPSGGTILSYCHIHTGYMTNIDVRFHSRVQQVLQDQIETGGCVIYDCNDNGIDDAIDISVNFTSADVNSNGIPDECEDCNDNGILDPTDILNLTSADINSNGIPDECESDCNNNGIPDEFEISDMGVIDVNGNNIPDVCEPDCDGNGIADFIDIADGTLTDFDRDNIPDICQDCNGNGVTDWVDLERQHNLFVGDIVGGLREYHARSGWPVTTESAGGDLQPFDVTLGPDRQLYIANFGALGERVYRLDPLSGVIVPLVLSGGSLDKPSGIAIDGAGQLYVADRDNNAIRKYDRLSGAFISDFVPSGSGGLSAPYGMVFNSDGDLLVTSSGNSRVIKYDGSTGAPLGDFISAGDGGLFGPRAMVFVPSLGDYLVTSYDGNQLLQFDGGTGAFVRVFNDLIDISHPWGITLNSVGNIVVARSGGTPRVLEYVPEGRYHRYYIRNEADMTAPTGLVFLPQSQFDIDNDGILDACTGAGCCLVAGDADNSGSANIADVTFMIARIFNGGSAPVCADQADANGDNSVNIADVTFVIARIFSAGAAPVCGSTGI